MSNARVIQKHLQELKRLRQSSNIPEAFMALDEIEGLIGQSSQENTDDLLGTFHYERAFVYLLCSSYKLASREFLRSSEAAERAGDRFRALTGRLMAVRNDYFGGELDALALRDSLLDIEESYIDLPKPDERDEGARRSFDFTLAKSIADAEFDCKGGNALQRARAASRSEVVQLNKGVPAYMLISHQLEARIAMADGKYSKAVSIFASYLDFDLSDQLNIQRKEQNVELIEFVRHWRDQICRDYRDFGFSVLKSSLTERESLSAKIWVKGLSIGTASNNLVFCRDIENGLIEFHDM